MDWPAPSLASGHPVTSRLATSPHTAGHTHLDSKIHYQLSRLDRSVPFRPIRRHLHHTWARTFYSRPELFFQPDTVQELQKIVTLARRCRKRLCVTGFGHSPSTLTCTSSWLINLDNLSRVLEVDIDGKPGHIRFQAGISLHDLNQALASHGYTLPNLGSIDVQSLAGAISTGTHGSSLYHGLLSQSITSLTVLLSNSQLVSCSAQRNSDLFRAALCSLGSLGIIVEMTLQAVPDFNIAWTQSVHPLSEVLETWQSTLWTTKEYTRVWWLPYLQRAVIWRAEKTTALVQPPKQSFYGGRLGFYVYHNLLAISNYIPSMLPWIEWFVFGMQYGFQPGSVTTSAVEPAREGLLMDCLYSQFVNEWAIPLSKGPEAITRLSAWLNHDDARARIPFSSSGLYVHCPVEVRVADTNLASATNLTNASGTRPFLDPTRPDEPTLYLNATLYRPYGRDPPCHLRYYEAFEWLMKDLNGRPHWAKNFAFTDVSDLQVMYGDDLQRFMRVRDEMDPEGMFLGQWHCKNLPIDEDLVTGGDGADDGTAQGYTGKGKGKPPRRSLVEGEQSRKKMGFGWGDGVLWEGAALVDADNGDDDEDQDTEGEDGRMSYSTSTFDMTSHTSEESFDLMAKGEASVHFSQSSSNPESGFGYFD